MFYLLRKSFYVKPKLLFKYIFYALLTVIFTSICILVVMRRTIYTTEALENLVSESEIRAVQSAIVESWWIPVVILLLVIGIQSLIRFHKIVGPIYALEKIISMIKGGYVGGHITLRRGDELKDLASEVENMSNALKNYVKKDRSIIAEISAELDNIAKLSNPSEIKNRLSEVKNKLSKITSDFHINE
ncbi:MAG: hypothetical protein COS68_00515 [Elusimicrobia bacterium CG06_land_8_20_14_3_00_38_11]|nr:MAG: hypothetical protein COS68_00515 [Elusimicrobia bacterium CG06_land_8_20_14_3_00_38_11]